MHSRKAWRWGIPGAVSAGVFAAVLCAGTPAFAQQPAPQPPVPPRIAPPQTVAPSQTVTPPGTQLLLQRLQNGLTLERYLDNLRTDFFQIDAGSDGKITPRDVELHSLMEGIQVRTAALMSVMRYDLDGDGAVTDDEVRRAMRYDLRAQLSSSALNAAGLAIPPINGSEKMIEDNVRSIMALDTDKDGKVNYAEALKFKFPGLQPMFGVNGQSGRARQALTLDSGSKGELTLADYQAAGEALFRKVDTDSDGEISPQELADYRGKPLPPDSAARKAAFDAHVREQTEAAQKKHEADVAAQAGCDMPAASDKAKVVLLSGYQTDALSSAALGSQDVVVHAGRVVVEPGDKPLYIVLATYAPTIWQFSGAVERIERLIMGGSLGSANSRDPKQPPLAGAAGVARERITFLARPNCLSYFSEAPSASSLQAAATIRTSSGKAPDVIAAKYSIGSISVPSGKIETLREQRRQPLVIMKSQGSLNIIGDASNVIVQSGPSRAREEMDRFFPGGVTQIDPKSVVADVPVATYEVLPAQAGLVQLLTSGAVTQNDAGEYIVRQKIRFPAGLSGALSVTFLIMKGTPYPDGDPAHSCVIVEETGESKGSNCRTR